MALKMKRCHVTIILIIFTSGVWLIFPAPIFRFIFGEMADELFLASQRVNPLRLIEAGFQFRFPTMKAAFNDIFGEGF